MMTPLCGKLVISRCHQCLSSINSTFPQPQNKGYKPVHKVKEHLQDKQATMPQEDVNELPIPAYFHHFWHHHQSVSIYGSALRSKSHKLRHYPILTLCMSSHLRN
jgi:hypothetical protein